MKNGHPNTPGTPGAPWRKALAIAATVPMMLTLAPTAGATETANPSTDADAALAAALAQTDNDATASADTAAGPSGLDAYTDEANLIAGYDFNDVKADQTGALADSTGKATATINGKAAVTTGKDGTTALTLGSGDWLTVTNADAGNTAVLKGKHAVTISYDSKANQTKAGWSVFAAPGTTKQEYGKERYLGFLDWTNTITAERYNNSGTRVSTANVSAASSGDWKHIDLVVADGFSALYVDGQRQAVSTEITNQTLPEILGEDGGVLQVGKGNWGNGEYFTGAIDNLRIYDSTGAAIADDLAKAVPATASAGFTLPTSSNGAAIAWTSSDAAIAVDAATGKATVTRPAADAKDATVTLTAKADGFERTYTVTVPREESAMEKATADLDATGLANGQVVRTSITLPTVGAKHGTAITWTSSDPDVITDSASAAEAGDGIAPGIVTRPSGADRTVVLTATAGEGADAVTRRWAVTVKQAVEQPKTTDYLFAHFTGTEGSATDEQMYFATSSDGLQWTDLHTAGNPVLTSDLGEKGVRDPYLVRSPEGDTFYLIATDLSIYHRGGWGKDNPAVHYNGSLNLIVWQSHDLVHWDAPYSVDVASKIPHAAMAWAPEAYWIPELGQYMVYWATTSDQDDQDPDNADPTNMYYSLTRDFRTFSDPVKWIDRTNSVIDTTMIKADDGYYYRVSAKDDLGIERTKKPTAVSVVSGGDGYNHGTDDQQWELVGYFRDLVGDPQWTGKLLEGPELFRYNDDDVPTSDAGKQMKYGMIWDQFATGKGYLPFYSADLGSTDTADWAAASEVNFGSLKKRHGTILPITAEELQAVTDAYADNKTPDAASPESAPASVTLLDDAGHRAPGAAALATFGSATFDVFAVDDGGKEATPAVTSSDPSAVTATIKDGRLVVTGTPKGGTATVTVSLGSAKATVEVTAAALTFTDVTAQTPHTDDIAWLAASGISGGFPNGDGTYAFGGMRDVVRQDMAAFLYRLAGSPDFTPSDEDKAKFSDVDESTPHHKEIWWLASTGIAKGYDDGTFGGMRTVVRQDMAAFLHRYAKWAGTNPALGDGKPFSDVKASTPHAADIIWMVRAGVTSGYPDGTFGGMRTVVRQDMAAFLHRMSANVLGK